MAQPAPGRDPLHLTVPSEAVHMRSGTVAAYKTQVIYKALNTDGHACIHEQYLISDGTMAESPHAPLACM